VAAVARDDITEAEAETRRDFAEVDPPRAMERIRITADIVLTVESDGAARGDDSGREDAVVVTKD